MSSGTALSHPKRLLFSLLYLLILAASTAAVVGAAELLASRSVRLPGELQVRDVRLNHTWPPSSTSFHDEWVKNNPDFPTPYFHRYNRQAWIAHQDTELRKPPGMFRIFYVGDSFTESCVPMEESLPKRVEERLNQLYAGSGTRFETINTGTSSYSPSIEYVLIRSYILPYAPDLVVLNVDMTDDYDEWVYRHTLINDDDGNPWAVPPRDLQSSPFVTTAAGALRANLLRRVNLLFYEHSYVYNFLYQRARRTDAWQRAAAEDAARLRAEPGGGTAYPAAAWCGYEWDAATRDNVARLTEMLGRIADLLNAHGVKLLLTGVPHFEQFAARPGERPEWSDRPHREIEAVARAKGVAYFDSLAALAPKIAGSPQALHYYRGDMHFNPRGNALWADAHLAALLDPGRGLLPPRPATAP